MALTQVSSSVGRCWPGLWCKARAPAYPAVRSTLAQKRKTPPGTQQNAFSRKNSLEMPQRLKPIRQLWGLAPRFSLHRPEEDDGLHAGKACRSGSRSPRCALSVPPVPHFPLMRVILVINLPDPRHWRVAPGTSPSHAAARCPVSLGIHWLPGPRCRDRAATSSRQGWPGCPGARIASQLPHCIRALYL